MAIVYALQLEAARATPALAALIAMLRHFKSLNLSNAVIQRLCC